jgi:hypothetical protein
MPQRLSIWRTWLVAMITTCGYAQQCFTPLVNPRSRDVANWEDLRTFSPPDSDRERSVKAFLRIPDGRGDLINLDFYSLTFAKPSGKSITEVFKDLRLHFQNFAQGPSREYDFFSYPVADIEVNAESKRNLELWKLAEPKGALMRFSLIGYQLPTLAFSKSDPQKFTFVFKAGDVQCTCASSRDFIFSTVETTAGGKHPVAGNRGFGLKDNNDGTWTFYTKGADRESTFFGNYAPDRGTSEYLPRETIFDRGHDFWMFFFKNLESYLNSQGMTVQAGSFTPNSGRAPYPP